MAVQQQLAGELGQPEAQERQDEQLVPEHVPAVGLSVQTAGRYANVEPDRVVRHRLQQMEDVQVQRARHVTVGAELDARVFPELAPAHHVTLEQVLEGAGNAHEPVACLLARFADPLIARGEDRRDLLDDGLLPAFDRQRQVERDVALPLDQLRLDCETRAVTEQSGARRLRDPYVRLIRLDEETDQLIVLPVGAQRRQVLLG